MRPGLGKKTLYVFLSKPGRIHDKTDNRNHPCGIFGEMQDEIERPSCHFSLLWLLQNPAEERLGAGLLGRGEDFPG